VPRQRRKRAGVADELDLSNVDREPCLEVPYGGAGAGCHPPPPQDIFHRDVGERLHCSLERRRRGGASVGGQQSEAVEQQVDGAQSGRRRRKGPDRATDLDERAASGNVRRRGPGHQVRLARELEVERLESPRRLQQHCGGIRIERGKGDLPAHQVDAGALELVERPILRRRQQPQRYIERGCLIARPGGSQRALRAPLRVLCERDGALQERRRGGQAAARLCPAG
jgi:hypothetical protein